MRTLLSKSFLSIFISTAIVLIASGPLFFMLMEKFYMNDIDEVIKYRSMQFKEEQLPLLSHIEINTWNRYNPDVQVLEFNPNTKINKPYNIVYLDKRKKVEVNYRVLNTLVNLDHHIHILHIRVPMIDRDDLIENISVQHSLLAIFILVALLILHRTSSKKLWRPFYETLDQLKEFNMQKNYVPILTKSNTKEFEQLNENLIKLMNKALTSFNTHKHFIENASHELQTPIAVFKSQLDLLLQDPNLTEEQTKVVQALYNNTSRISKLNKNLLLLAKIDNQQFEDQELVQVHRMVDDFYIQFKEIAQHKDADIVTSVVPVTIRTNKALLEIALSNLISNAIRYNKPYGGVIIIDLTATSLTVTNSSVHDKLDENCIFQRFAKTKCGQQKRNGLGLAIVKQICDYNHWRITYNYTEGRHSFTIRF